MSSLRRHLSYANVIATMALFLALSGGVAVAVTTIPDADGTINGCYSTTGSLRVVPGGEVCKRTETALPWNQKGPKGDKGDTGPAGPSRVMLYGTRSSINATLPNGPVENDTEHYEFVTGGRTASVNLRCQVTTSAQVLLPKGVSSGRVFLNNAVSMDGTHSRDAQPGAAVTTDGQGGWSGSVSHTTNFDIDAGQEFRFGARFALVPPMDGWLGAPVNVITSFVCHQV